MREKRVGGGGGGTNKTLQEAKGSEMILPGTIFR